MRAYYSLALGVFMTMFVLGCFMLPKKAYAAGNYYISIPLNTHSITKNIVDAYQRIDSSHKVNWQPGANFHITLVHFGNMSLSRMEQKKVESIIKNTLKHFSNMPIIVDAKYPIDFGNGSFGKLMIHSKGNLRKLQKALIDELNKAGFSGSTCKAPHITIARQPGPFGQQVPFTQEEQNIINLVGAELAGKTFFNKGLVVKFRVNAHDISTQPF